MKCSCSECEARFFLYTEYVSKLEEMSLILMTGRFADTDNSSAVVNESADRFDDLRVFPPFSSCMRRICIPDIDDHIDIVKDRRIIQNILEVDKYNVKRRS